MTSPRWTRVLLAPLAILCWACSDVAPSPTNPTKPSDKPADPVQSTIPKLVVSDVIYRSASGTAASALGGTAEDVAYVSLPPGAIPNAVSVQIRNLTSGGPRSEAVVVEGGFDPVAVAGAEDDQLELSFTRANGEVTTGYIKIPVRRPPVIVRTSPPKGRTDVPLSSRVAVVFSEPIDGGTITGVRLERDGSTVPARLERLATSPWVVEVVPNEEMQPLSTYQVVITQGVRDVEGDATPETETVPFTTGPRLPVSGQIAFASNREGSWNIYVANADGSGMVRLTAGERPSWSPDGRRLAIDRGNTGLGGWFPQGAAIYLINADGSGETKLIDGMDPAWSPDGQRIAFVDSEGISLINVNGSGLTRLIRHDARLTSDPGLYSRAPAWSPDGRQIAFEYNRDPEDWFAQRIWVVNADGSEPRILTQYSDFEAAECNPAWSPDGTAIVFWTFEFGVAFQDPRRVGAATPIYGGFGAGVVCSAAPVWSPDGKAIAFTAFEPDETRIMRQRICLFGLADREKRLLVADVVAPAKPAYSDVDVAWSPVPR